MYFGTFHHRDPRATNARAEFKGTGHTQLSSSRHFICKLTLPNLHNPLYLHKPYQTHFTFTNLIKPTLPSQTLSNPLYLHKPYQTYFITTLQLNLTKPFQLSEPCELLFELLLTHSLFIPLGVKPLFIVVVVVVYKFCCTYKSFVILSSKVLAQISTAGLFFYKT